jgi:hypothetical protein
LLQEVSRSRFAIRRAVIALQRPAARARTRSPLRLSLMEREAISRGLVSPTNHWLREIVEAKLAARWSPQQIPGWLKATYGASVRSLVAVISEMVNSEVRITA